MVALTEKQKAYRENVIPKRKRKHKPHTPLLVEEKPKDSFIEQKMKYLKNCIFWINEYNEGRGSREKLSETVKAIEHHCAEIRIRILNN